MFGEIESKWFEGLKNLRILELDANRLTRFDLSGLDLVELDLSANQLTTVEFGQQKNLAELNLGSNRLASIPNLSGLVNLRRLRIDNNQIAAIGADSFSGLENIVEINLSRNKIDRIDQNSLRGLAELVELNLSSNQVESLPSLLFRDQAHVEKLKLNNNRIGKIDPDLFEGLEKLIEIDLSLNGINEIDKRTFRGLKSLKLLRLGSNLLSTLPVNVFEDLSSLSELWLDNNRRMRDNVAPELFEPLVNVRLVSISDNWRPYCSDSSVFEYLKLKLGRFNDFRANRRPLKCYFDFDMFLSQFSTRGKLNSSDDDLTT